MTFRCEYVRCGRCRGGCAHGPYWYGYWRQGGKVKKKYYGKVDPRPRPGSQTASHDPLDAIFNRRTASLDLALRILGILRVPTIADLKKLYRRLVLVCHPDAGGDGHKFAQVSAAYSYVQGFAK